MKTFKCPSCDADLSFSEDREFGFCEYCGTKIMLENHRVTQRIIDEAKIKEAEVREKELDFEIKKLNIKLEKEQSLKKRKRIVLRTYFVSFSILFIASFILYFVSESLGCVLGTFTLLFLLYGGFFIHLYFEKIKNEENDRIALESGGIHIPLSIDDVESFDYLSLSSILEKSGFINVETCNLHDIFIFGKPNMVESVTINGRPMNTQKIYMPNDLIIIKYHGR